MFLAGEVNLVPSLVKVLVPAVYFSKLAAEELSPAMDLGDPLMSVKKMRVGPGVGSGSQRSLL